MLLLSHTFSPKGKFGHGRHSRKCRACPSGLTKIQIINFFSNHSIFLSGRYGTGSSSSSRCTGACAAGQFGQKFDIWSSGIVIFGNAVPGFLFAILLIVIFSGGRYLDWFPLRGLTSPGFEAMSTFERIIDYFWHLTLPLISMVIGGFAGLTMLTKNSFIEEINKQYVLE